MSSSDRKQFGIERVALGVLATGLGVSLVVTVVMANKPDRLDIRSVVESNEAIPLDIRALESSIERATDPLQSDSAERNLLVGEFRVIAIGSAYPIPYEADYSAFMYFNLPLYLA